MDYLGELLDISIQQLQFPYVSLSCYLRPLKAKHSVDIYFKKRRKTHNQFF